MLYFEKNNIIITKDKLILMSVERYVEYFYKDNLTGSAICKQ